MLIPSRFARFQYPHHQLARERYQGLERFIENQSSGRMTSAPARATLRFSPPEEWQILSRRWAMPSSAMTASTIRPSRLWRCRSSAARTRCPQPWRKDLPPPHSAEEADALAIVLYSVAGFTPKTATLLVRFQETENMIEKRGLSGPVPAQHHHRSPRSHESSPQIWISVVSG